VWNAFGLTGHDLANNFSHSMEKGIECLFKGTGKTWGRYGHPDSDPDSYQDS
jgi:hypothetical protein